MSGTRQEQERSLTNEEAALRRVATLIARESPPAEIFGAVTEEGCRVLATEAVGLLRFDADGTAILVAQSDTPWDPPPLGTRFTLEGENVVAQVFRTGRAARVDDWTTATGAVAAMATVLGVRSAVASPIVVEGRLWGTIIAATSRSEPLPSDTEPRLAQFTGLAATAVANLEARAKLSRLLEEQAALRRVAVLVAQQPSPDEVFTAVTAAVGPLLGADLAAMHTFRGDGVATVIAGWSEGGPMLPIGSRLPLDGENAIARVFRTQAAARIDSYVGAEGQTAEVARDLRLRSTVGAPILVEGRLWGALMAATRGEEPLPEDAETRIAAFTELVATAVSNAQARGDLQGLADEQAALRRVATLAAGGAGPEEVFRAVAAEVGPLFGSDVSAIVRFEDDGMATVLGDVGGPHQAGARVSLDPGYVVHEVRESGRSARFDTEDPSVADASSLVRTVGVRSAVASPIVVDGRLWGAITAASLHGRLSSAAERRLNEFTDLVATAVANTQAREQVMTLAEEQAALRRVATLVALEASHGDVFAAITEGIGGLLREELRMVRFDADTAVVVAASDGPHVDVLPVGSRLALGGENAISRVFRTGQRARIDDYAGTTGEIADAVRPHGVRSAVATPIVVEGRRWGAMLVGTFGEQPVPADTEDRLAQFTDLMATAIAKAEARAEIARLAEEQAALRRVATLVAEGADSPAVFDAVCAEAGRMVGATSSNLTQFTPDGIGVVVAGWGPWDTPVPVGTRAPLTPDTLGGAIVRTRAPARRESWEGGATEELARAHGIRSAVGAPVVVDGQLWGALAAATNSETPLVAGTEHRLASFTELVATAISNASARSELIASRARIVSAGDEARRRIERNLHDGTQQRLIALGLDLQRARATIRADPDAQAGFDRIEQDLESILEDLRDLSHGLHPPLLARSGLRPPLQALVRRSPIPVQLDVDLPERPPVVVETAVYYIVSEALANAVKHSHASAISITISSGRTLGATTLHATVADDGVGAAEPGVGSGLIGLADRVNALGGRLTLESPSGIGTRVSVELPFESPVVRAS